MRYQVSLQLKIENNHAAVGRIHEFQWDNRGLIQASSGWMIVNSENLGIASDIIPKLHKGILELKGNSEHYREFELSQGFGTIKNIISFYEDLLADCQQYPYAELRGSVAG